MCCTFQLKVTKFGCNSIYRKKVIEKNEWGGGGMGEGGGVIGNRINLILAGLFGR